MANIYEKIPCGGFYVDTTVLEFQNDKETNRPFLTVTGNIPTAGSDFIILKSSQSDKQFKITVNDAGTVNTEEVQE